MAAEPIVRLAELVAGARSPVALTGAGISVASGIPDFRSPGTGLWAGVDPMQVAHIDAWRSDPQRFWSFYGQRFALLDGVAPNAAHRALVDLEARGRLTAVITQNIDGLHQAAGSGEVVELHGTIASSVCLQDGERVGLAEARRRLAEAPDGVPRCAAGHPLKPEVVLFGELLPEAAMERALELLVDCDLLLCLGSSLQVQPVGDLPSVVRAGGGRIAVLTQGPTPWDDVADVRLDGSLERDLPALVAALA